MHRNRKREKEKEKRRRRNKEGDRAEGTMTAEQFTTAVTFLFISTASQSPHETSSHRQQILKKKKRGSLLSVLFHR